MRTRERYDINRRIDNSGRGGNKNVWKVSCPHPDCDHVGELITKVHCRMHHNMERDELIGTYGQPQPVELNARHLSENSRIRTIIPNNAPTISGQKRGSSRR